MSEQMSFEGFGSGTSLQEFPAGVSPAASQVGPMSAKSSPPASRVSRGAKRGAAKVRTTQGIYGPIHCPLSLDSAPKSPWESRLMDLMETFGSTERELIWKRLDTASGQSYFQLAVSTPRPVAIAGGGSPAEQSGDAKLWSGLRSTDGEKGGPNMQFGAGGMPLPAEAAAVADARLWSAVQQRDGGHHGSQAKRFLRSGAEQRPTGRSCPDRGAVADDSGYRSKARIPAETDRPEGHPAVHNNNCVGGWGRANGDGHWDAYDWAIGPDRDKRTGRLKSRGSLSSRFAAWLQGYPQAHLNCAPSCLPKAKRSGRTKSKATATA